MNTGDEWASLVRALAAEREETEWLEFKHNNDNPEKIGETLSALANGAARHGQPYGYIIWGIENQTHNFVGTDFRPRESKCSGQPLERYLSTQLRPSVALLVKEVSIDDLHVVVFRVDAAAVAPISYRGEEWIRIDSHNQQLRKLTAVERELWRSFDSSNFETSIIVHDLSAEALAERIWFHHAFSKKADAPSSIEQAIPALIRWKFVVDEGGSRYGITNLGAILLAKNLEKFESLREKKLRVVFYKGPTKLQAYEEKPARRGYAASFRNLIGFLMSRLPSSEEIKSAIRLDRPLYPEIALRELIANALVHQDFEISGAGPMVEIFGDRIEITNPGRPLVQLDRLLDMPHRSRNEKIAEHMSRLGICERRGTGIDKVVNVAELWQLPPPDFRIVGDNTTMVLFAPKPFAKMTPDQRIRACYQHAQLLSVAEEPMTNESLRNRFGIDAKNYSVVSRIIADAREKGLIKPYDPDNTSNRHAKYVPYWK